jgi:rhodanese-related sulfurtransferase
MLRHRLSALLLAIALLAAACGGEEAAGTGIRVVSATAAAEIHENPPEGLVVLDVRTAEEFAEGHLDGAIMIDFYGDDFTDRLAELDRDRPYLLYCRSGNRSSQARQIMIDLGFTDVADIDGGILAWTRAELPLTTT